MMEMLNAKTLTSNQEVLYNEKRETIKYLLKPLMWR